VHLVRQQPERLPVVLLVLIGAPVMGLMLMGHWLFAVAAFWMVFSAMADYLLPIRYEMDAQGVRQKGWSPRVMSWDRVRRVVWGEQGVLLSPFAQPSRLDAFRGIFLWYGDHADGVRAWIERYCHQALSERKGHRARRKRGVRAKDQIHPPMPVSTGADGKNRVGAIGVGSTAANRSGGEEGL
jgi:hypothetical protein